MLIESRVNAISVRLCETQKGFRTVELEMETVKDVDELVTLDRIAVFA